MNDILIWIQEQCKEFLDLNICNPVYLWCVIYRVTLTWVTLSACTRLHAWDLYLQIAVWSLLSCLRGENTAANKCVIGRRRQKQQLRVSVGVGCASSLTLTLMGWEARFNALHMIIVTTKQCISPVTLTHLTQALQWTSSHLADCFLLACLASVSLPAYLFLL